MKYEQKKIGEWYPAECMMPGDKYDFNGPLSFLCVERPASCTFPRNAITGIEIDSEYNPLGYTKHGTMARYMGSEEHPNSNV